MANQPRPWFRLASMARPAGPAPAPAPAPEPTSVQPRPPLIRPTFRPIAQLQPTQPTQPQEPTPAPPAPAPAPAPVVAAPTPTPASTNGVASVPTSPTPRTSASLPTSPVHKTSPTTKALPVTTTISSVPPSPKPRASSPPSSVPTIPAPKAAPSTSSVPSSPAPKAAPSTSSVHTSPAPKAVATSPVKTVPTSSSVTTSPVARAATTTTATTTITSTTVPAAMTHVPSPTPSTKPIKPVAKTPPESPKRKPTAPPPSPLTLPPSQIKSDADHQPKIPLEAEQKTVLVQKTIEKPKEWLNSKDSEIKRGTAHNVKKDVETKEKGHHKKLSSDSDDSGMRVITIAGENKGALMEVIHSPKKHGFEGNPHHLHNKGNSRMNDGSEWHSHSSSSGEEGSSKMKDKSHNGKTTPSLPMSAFMNSNVQGVNNSIVFNSSCTHHDPGVHLALSRKPSGGGFHVKDHGNGHQS